MSNHQHHPSKVARGPTRVSSSSSFHSPSPPKSKSTLQVARNNHISWGQLITGGENADNYCRLILLLAGRKEGSQASQPRVADVGNATSENQTGRGNLSPFWFGWRNPD